MCHGKISPMGPHEELWGVELRLCNPKNPARSTVVSAPRRSQHEAEAAVRDLSVSSDGCPEPEIDVVREYKKDPNFFVETFRRKT